MEKIKLQCLLKPESRTKDGLEAAAKALAALGIETTTRGMNTLSMETEAPIFTQLFGRKRAASATSRTAPGLGGELENLPIPESLQPFIEMLSVPPMHINLKSLPNL